MKLESVEGTRIDESARKKEDMLQTVRLLGVSYLLGDPGQSWMATRLALLYRPENMELTQNNQWT